MDWVAEQVRQTDGKFQYEYWVLLLNSIEKKTFIFYKL
jgi:hypothetical protein